MNVKDLIQQEFFQFTLGQTKKNLLAQTLEKLKYFD